LNRTIGRSRTDVFEIDQRDNSRPGSDGRSKKNWGNGLATQYEMPAIAVPDIIEDGTKVSCLGKQNLADWIDR